ncbi:MAG: L,D-transpeptidase family protein [Pseudomonadales bacterium]|nr:L,D-transpeptidase family protein [Pseudomonadales bacterium]
MRVDTRVRRGDRPGWLALAVVLLCLSSPVAAAAVDAVSGRLAARLDGTSGDAPLEVHGVPVLGVELSRRLYRERHHALLWVDPVRRDALIRLVANAIEHGLNPDDYNLETLLALRSGAREGSEASVDRDILFTESLIRLLYHRRFGKVDPASLQATWRFDAPLEAGVDPASTLASLLASHALAQSVARLLRKGPRYRGLQAALRRHREIAAAGGWPRVPEGPSLRVGDRDPRVSALRARLQMEGDAEATSGSRTNYFDGALEEAVRRFQARHDLRVDGVVGPATLGALEVPVAARVDQLRIALDQLRWIVPAIEGRYVVINVASAEVRVVRDGQDVWQRRAIVGRPLRPTPILLGEIAYLDINPSWTIPPAILEEDVLPKVRADPTYLDRSRIRVLDASGRRVDPYGVDWATLEHVPYTLQQAPGPENPLGAIKFVCPNEHYVFLHDTPHREQFAARDRRLSSGCVRVEDPFAFAALILEDPDDWSEAALTALAETGETRRVLLDPPWPVYVLYLTAELDAAGRVRFLRDAYAREAELLRALDAGVPSVAGEA